jgi:hypothetical protein
MVGAVLGHTAHLLAPFSHFLATKSVIKRSGKSDLASSALATEFEALGERHNRVDDGTHLLGAEATFPGGSPGRR